MNEQKKIKKTAQEAEMLYETYRDQMDVLEKTNLGKVRSAQGSSLSMWDYWALGKQLESWDDFVEMCEDANSVNSLGKIPTIAHDVITVVQGTSIMPVIASTQPIDDERGSVYFKNVQSGETKGSQTKGDTVLDPREGVTTPDGYASNKIDSESLGPSVDTQTDYSGNLQAVPVRSETLKITTSIAGVEGLDVGPADGADPNVGRIFGKGISGTINYTTGAYTLKFDSNPGAGETITAQYQQNYERAGDVPSINSLFASKTIQARMYTLKGTLGMFQSFAMSKRFKMMGEEELAKELVNEINREVGGDMIRLLNSNAQGTVTFDRALPSGVSRFEHDLTWKKSKASAEAKIVQNAGRGTINAAILGLEHAALVETLPGFKKLFDGKSVGAHVYGTLDDMVIVRVTESALLPTDEGIMLHKGDSPFEAAGVWSPFMPLVVTGVIPEAPNPLINQRAAAMWAGVDSLIPNFATKLNVANI